MTDITTRQAYARPVSRVEQRADALAEMRQLHSDFEVLQHKAEDQARLIDRLNDRNGLLLDQLRISQQNERIAVRKLIRLATAMSSIGMLSREAEEIVKSAREWQEDEGQQDEQAAEITTQGQ